MYGHHKHVATKEDPATARRGENFYFYFIRCVISSVISSWNIEKNMLQKNQISAPLVLKQNDSLFCFGVSFPF